MVKSQVRSFSTSQERGPDLLCHGQWRRCAVWQLARPRFGDIAGMAHKFGVVPNAGHDMRDHQHIVCVSYFRAGVGMCSYMGIMETAYSFRDFSAESGYV